MRVGHFASLIVPCMRHDVLEAALFQRYASTAPPRSNKKRFNNTDLPRRVLSLVLIKSNPEVGSAMLNNARNGRGRCRVDDVCTDISRRCFMLGYSKCVSEHSQQGKRSSTANPKSSTLTALPLKSYRARRGHELIIPKCDANSHHGEYREIWPSIHRKPL